MSNHCQGHIEIHSAEKNLEPGSFVTLDNMPSKSVLLSFAGCSNNFSNLSCCCCKVAFSNLVNSAICSILPTFPKEQIFAPNCVDNKIF